MARARDIKAQAAEWLVRSEAALSPDDQVRFVAWMANPRHRAMYHRVQQSWSRFDRLREMRPLDPHAPADVDIVDKFHRFGLTPMEPHRPPFPGFCQWLAAAVIAFLCVSIGLSLATAVGGAMWDVYETGVGGREHVMLADGSEVQLNTNTRIRVRLTNNARRVELVRGEALFTVAPDPSRPFSVTADNTTVRAVGTAFSVRLRDEAEVDVLLNSGRVAVSLRDAGWPLGLSKAGMSRVGVSKAEAPPTLLSERYLAEVRGDVIRTQQLSLSEIRRRQAWLEGLIEFRGETLVEAAAEINRYNLRQVVVADTAIASHQLGGTFKATDIESFVALVENEFDVRSEWVMGQTPSSADDVIRLKRAGEEMPVP